MFKFFRLGLLYKEISSCRHNCGAAKDDEKYYCLQHSHVASLLESQLFHFFAFIAALIRLAPEIKAALVASIAIHTAAFLAKVSCLSFFHREHGFRSVRGCESIE
jgi:hypothetical protein